MSNTFAAAGRILLAGAILAAAGPVYAQQTAPDPAAAAQQVTDDRAAAAAAAAAPDASTAAPCKPRKKKGFGLGGILRVAQRTGLTSMVGGGILGQAGAVTGTAINTAVGVADAASARAEQPRPDC